MKQNHLWLGLLTLTILLSACAPAATSTPAAVPPTKAVPASTPTLQTVAVDTTPPIGSTLPWFDTSTLIYVPVGEFSMGADDPSGQDFNPAHAVTLDAFWIYSTKVTLEMFNLCVAAGQCTLTPASDSTEPASTVAGTSIYLARSDPNDPGTKDLPITDMTWDQASAYCRWTGGRLPTEAEWEKTARGTANQAYPWGDAAPSCNLLNFGGCSGYLSGVLDHPAGMSEYKAFDMVGNTFEWVSDWYQADFYAASPSANPTGPEAGAARSVRGSSFESTADATRSFVRHSLAPDQHKVDLGFRCLIPDPAIFAPMCSAPAQIPANASTTPQAGQPASVNGGSSSKTTSFDPDLMNLRVENTFCVNKSAKIGAATVTWNFGPAQQWAAAHCTKSAFGVLLNDSTIYGIQPSSTVGTKITNTLAGPEEHKFLLQPYMSYCALKQPSVSITKSLPATCAAGYSLQSNGICQYTGSSGQSGSIACPTGYSYSQQAQCCTVNPAQSGNPANQYPACGPGSMFDAQQQVCYKTVSANQTFKQTFGSVPVTLGSCTDEKPKDTDKPKKPQQPPPPPPCTIDPATGACN